MAALVSNEEYDEALAKMGVTHAEFSRLAQMLTDCGMELAGQNANLFVNLMMCATAWIITLTDLTPEDHNTEDMVVRMLHSRVAAFREQRREGVN